MTVEFLLACMPHSKADAFWRVVTWNTVFGLPDEKIQLMSDEKRAITQLQTHSGEPHCQPLAIEAVG